MNHRAFAEMLVNIGVLTAEHLEPSRSDPAAPTSWSKRLLGASRMTPGEFADLMAKTQVLPRASLDRMRRGTSLAAEFSLPFLHEAGLYPYRAPDGSLRLATADPFAIDAVDAIAVTLGGGVAVEVATFEDVELALDADKRANDAEAQAEDGGSSEAGPDNSDSLRDLASGAPVVRALDDVFDAAVSLRASDIHFEPLGRDIQIRVRVDGVLRVIASPRAAPARALVSRIKILAGLNIAEHRQPQDGRMRIKVRSRDFDVRVATMPTTTGEAAILRLLDRSGRLVEFGQLGFNARDRAVLSDKLTQPHGMIVVTGPTGSGKTTTLTAALASLNDATRKILTIEDPVEYEIPGVNQSQVRPAAGLTFATALRAFMRQDPDVIMVGEVRDPETAKIAVQASLTGHVVMTTLHTNTAAAAVTRLVDIGVERYLIASTLSVVVGQRLVRTLCLDCRRAFTVGPREAERNPRIVGLGIRPGTALYEPVGCERCGGTGYRGRRAIFECLEITEAVRRQILAGADDAAIERAGIAEGMATLVEDGKARCLEGLTSVDEVFRVAALR